MNKKTPVTIAIKLKGDAQRMVRKEHPWIFESSISNPNIVAEAGTVAITFDQRKNQFMGFGLWDPDSPIRIKMIQFKNRAKFDAQWVLERFKKAYSAREELFKTDTNSYRLIFGENDQMASLIVDVYDNVAVIKLYSRIWIPYIQWIVDATVDTSAADTVVLRLSRSLVQKEHSYKDGQVLHGTLGNPEVSFREHGIIFNAHVLLGHKTGYFLDHRHNRVKIGQLSKNKDVLDVFSYAGGFSVHALANGARSVTSLDISKQALQLAKKNALLNTFEGKHSLLAGDAFVRLSELISQSKQFDIVIIDPPSFAKKSTEMEGALNSYKRLAKLGLKLVKPSGILLLASCSSRIKSDVFFDLTIKTIGASGKKYTILDKTYHDIDHPIGFPEGAYLKSIYFRIS